MKKIANQYRQGDVLVTPIANIPSTAKSVRCKRRIVLAEGEATGHCHSIDYSPKQMEVFVDGQQLYLKVNEPTVLKHQEHAAATITPGNYIVLRQTEVWLDEARNVRD